MKLKTQDGMEIEGDVGEVVAVLKALRGTTTPEIQDEVAEEVKEAAPQKTVPKKSHHKKEKGKVWSGKTILYTRIFGMTGSEYLKSLVKSGLNPKQAVNKMAKQIKKAGARPSIKRIKRRCTDLYTWDTKYKPKVSLPTADYRGINWKSILGMSALDKVAELRKTQLSNDEVVKYLVGKAEEAGVNLPKANLLKRVHSIIYVQKMREKGVA
jgi:DNA-binding protein H-NS